MTRLPQPGSDRGTWGDILNDFLSQSHNADGTIKQTALDSRIDAKIATQAVVDAGQYSPLAGQFYATGAGFDPTGAADSSTAFQAMINAASAAAALVSNGYATIVIPSGAKLKVGGIVPKSNVAIRSQGGALISNGDWQGIITNRTAQVAVDNFGVEGVEFIGEGLNVGTTSERRGALTIYGGSNIRIRDCYAHDFNYHGFVILDGRNVWIENNRLENLCVFGLGNAIHVGSQLANFIPAPLATSTVRVTGNTVRNCYTAPVCIQTTVIASEYSGPLLDFDAVVADNPFLEHVSATTGGFACIALEIGRSAGLSSQGAKLAKVSVHDNHCKVSGVASTTFQTAYGITVSDNNGGSGPQSSDYDEFSDIVIHHNTIDSIQCGILCEASRTIIDHNVVKATLGGVMVSYNGNASHVPEQIVIDGNIISLDATVATNAGINSMNTAHTTIQNNRVTYTGTPTNGQTPISNGIYGIGSSNIVVVGNTVRGSTRHGIHLLNVTGYAVDRNRVTNPSSASTGTYCGLYLDGATGNSPTKGSVRFNEFLDDRTGGGVMMYAGIGLNGGSPRAAIIGNRVLGVTAGYVTNAGLAYWIAQNDFGGGHPFGNVSVTPSASPFTYSVSVSSPNPYPQEVIVSGGTVTQIQKKRGGGAAVTTGLTAGIFRLEANDSLIVTYSSAPTMVSVPAI